MSPSSSSLHEGISIPPKHGKLVLNSGSSETAPQQADAKYRDEGAASCSPCSDGRTVGRFGTL